MTTFPDFVYHMGGTPVGGVGYGDGKVFWLDPSSGSDSNDGSTPALAKATMTAALGLCTDNRGDTIIRMPGSETPSAVINFNKAGVTVISTACLLGYGTNHYEPEKFSTYPAASYTTGPMAIISAPTALIGLEFVTRNTTHTQTDDMTTGSSALAVAGNAGGFTGGFNLIKSCKFVDWWGNYYGIEFGAGAYNRVQDCVFEGFTGGVVFRGTSLRNPTYNVVEYCKFIDCTSGIEHLPGTTQNFLYYNNWFIDCTDSIDFENQGANGLVAGNYYETATDTATYDITVAAAQALGIQFSGNHYSE